MQSFRHYCWWKILEEKFWCAVLVKMQSNSRKGIKMKTEIEVIANCINCGGIMIAYQQQWHKNTRVKHCILEDTQQSAYLCHKMSLLASRSVLFLTPNIHNLPQYTLLLSITQSTHSPNVMKIPPLNCPSYPAHKHWLLPPMEAVITKPLWYGRTSRRQSPAFSALWFLQCDQGNSQPATSRRTSLT